MVLYLFGSSYWCYLSDSITFWFQWLFRTKRTLRIPYSPLWLQWYQPLLFSEPAFATAVHEVRDCVFSRSPEPVRLYLVIQQTLWELNFYPGVTCWLLRNIVLPMPPLSPKLKEKVCSLVLMIHYTSGLWNGCVWLAKLKFYFDGQLLYELELFVKNIQWFILIWRKK